MTPRFEPTNATRGAIAIGLVILGIVNLLKGCGVI